MHVSFALLIGLSKLDLESEVKYEEKRTFDWNWCFANVVLYK